jgi:hypothetical protein
MDLTDPHPLAAPPSRAMERTAPLTQGEVRDALESSELERTASTGRAPAQHPTVRLGPPPTPAPRARASRASARASAPDGVRTLPDGGSAEDARLTEQHDTTNREARPARARGSSPRSQRPAPAAGEPVTGASQPSEPSTPNVLVIGGVALLVVSLGAGLWLLLS